MVHDFKEQMQLWDSKILRRKWSRGNLWSQSGESATQLKSVSTVIWIVGHHPNGRFVSPGSPHLNPVMYPLLLSSLTI
ncbi:hypothetical protein KIN20_005630 [Parelaphostrongylus tenuis]|uniref:Uncharacterized protein n=1 Tax=Parelaphostrongylus tenuis TaxID=148309 RepID=A0AAD5QIQ6_PARTN|nr:hypothetical protein KIN20_005630 [Parelaphostrongylus tenuis]